MGILIHKGNILIRIKILILPYLSKIEFIEKSQSVIND